MSRPRVSCQEGSPEQAAATWFARRRGGLTAHEELEFATWLATDPANRAAYDDVVQIWKIAGQAANDPRTTRMRGQAQMIRRRPRYLAIQVMAAAAVTLMVLGAGSWRFHRLTTASTPPIMSAAPLFFQTAVGERSTVMLDDGSVVTLNTGSKLRVDFTPTRRDVSLLAGQALFQVAKDRSRPFVVTAGDRQVVAVGTEFDVRLEPQGLRVALLEGRVKVRPTIPARSAGRTSAAEMPQEPEMVVTLEPGEQLSAMTGGAAVVRRAVVADLVSWREGRVRFDDTPLADAAAEMNRYSRTPIVVADPHVAKIRVSGAFRTGQSRSFVASITDLFPVRAEVTKDAIVLRQID